MMLRSRAFRTVDGLIDRIVCVAGALLFSQGPEFMQQYLQRLGGHLAEARRQLAGFHSAAQRGGISLDELLRKTNSHADPAIAQLGQVISESVARVDALQSAHDAIEHASMWTRPWAFARHADWEIVSATWTIYRPAFPTTVEGLAYGAVGLVCFLAAYQLLRALALRLAGPSAPRLAVARQ